MRVVLAVQARSLPTASLRPLFLAFNAVVYAVQIALWVLTGLATSSSTHNLLRVASCGFLAVVSICAAVGFLVYGGRLFLMLRRCALNYTRDLHGVCNSILLGVYASDSHWLLPNDCLSWDACCRKLSS